MTLREKIIKWLDAVPAEKVEQEKAALEEGIKVLQTAAKVDAKIIRDYRERYAELKKHVEKIEASIKLVEVEATGKGMDAVLELLQRCTPYIYTSHGEEEQGKFLYIQVVEE